MTTHPDPTREGLKHFENIPTGIPNFRRFTREMGIQGRSSCHGCCYWEVRRACISSKMLQSPAPTGLRRIPPRRYPRGIEFGANTSRVRERKCPYLFGSLRESKIRKTPHNSQGCQAEACQLACRPTRSRVILRRRQTWLEATWRWDTTKTKT